MGHQRYLSVSQRKERHTKVIEGFCVTGVFFAICVLLITNLAGPLSNYETRFAAGIAVASILCVVVAVVLGCIGPRNVDRRYR